MCSCCGEKVDLDATDGSIIDNVNDDTWNIYMSAEKPKDDEDNSEGGGLPSVGPPKGDGEETKDEGGGLPSVGPPKGDNE